MVREALGGLALDVLFGTNKVSKGSKELEDGEQGVSDVVMEGGLVLLGEATREQVVAMAVTLFFAEDKVPAKPGHFSTYAGQGSKLFKSTNSIKCTRRFW
jgi:hypothetical protein